MKRTIKQIMDWRTLTGTLLLLCSLSVQSCKDDEQTKWVDLRYKANDSYTIAASGEESVNIQVKSTDPWIVYSKHNDWCTISPNEGDNPETTYDVKISYKANTALDARTDIITIKSDYWIGKEVTVIQKGIAFLNLENGEIPILDKEGTQYPLKVKSNQKWSATVTEGNEWLSIESGENGTNDGTINLKALKNIGEKRIGKIVVYDRHGEEAHVVECAQEGIVLSPATLVLKALYEDTQVTLHVESNGDWNVKKTDETADWYSFAQTEYSGDGDIVITLTKNSSDAVNKATFQIASKSAIGTEPIVKTITLKQANHVVAEQHTFIASDWVTAAGKPVFNKDGSVTLTSDGSNCRITKNNMKPGTYRFHIKSSSNDAQCQHYFIYGKTEVRWMLFKKDKTTRCGTSDTSIIGTDFDYAQSEFTVCMNLLEYESSGQMTLQWLLKEGADGTEKQIHEIAPYSGVSYGTNADIIIGVTTGNSTYDWWEYTAPIEWGE